MNETQLNFPMATLLKSLLIRTLIKKSLVKSSSITGAINTNPISFVTKKKFVDGS